MHKKITKAALSGLMSAAMVATSVAAVASMTVNAGQVLGNGDFDDGTALPWHTCESQPAGQHFKIEGGKYKITIDENNGPDGRWDLQFRHRGITMIQGHEYTISGDITATEDGYIYAKIGNYEGDKEYWHNLSGQEWKPYQIKAGEEFHFEDTFTLKDSPVGPTEWAFHYSDNHGQYGNNDTGMPKGAVLTFDNLSLVDNTSDEGDFDTTNEFGVVRPRSNVRINQVGYYPNLEKRASYCTDNSSPCEFEVRDSSGKAVYTGTASKVVEDPDSGNGETTQTKYGKKLKDSGKYVQILDFSKLTTPGEYTIFVKDSVGVSDTACFNLKGAWDTKASGDKLEWTNWKTGKVYTMNESMKFKIDENIYDSSMLANAVNYYYQNRSGIPIESKYITSGDKSSLAHPAGHTKDDAYVQSEWVKFYSNKFDGDTSYQIDGVGGWYDAGDHGKYVVNGGVSVWTLQNMYEMSKHIGEEAKWDDGKTMAIPEQTNGKPDVLDEARVELEWFFDMMVKSDDPYFGKDAGMVYHKLHDHKWTGLAIHAWKYEGFEDMDRIVKPPTYAATLNMVACAAQAARLWKGIDDDFAEECLKNAKIGLAALENSGDGWKVAKGVSAQQDDVAGKNKIAGDVYFAPLDQAIGGGPYGDTYVMDDYYWALCELFATTGDKEYYDKLKTYSNPHDSTGADKAFSLTSNLGGGENKGSFSSFNWGCTSGLGTLSLYLNSDVLEKVDATAAKTVKDSIVTAADAYIAEENKQGMGIPYRGSKFTDEINIGLDDNGNPIEVEGYEWGSNSFVANNAIVMAYAYDATKTKKYIDGASTAMDYIFGRNGNDFSYVSGYGDRTLTYPHHRLWAHGVDPKFPLAPAGVLSGGPGAGMQDPYIGGLGFKRGTLASQKCYVDNAEAWSVNEITINWNAPLAWMTSYLEDVAPTVLGGDDEVEGTGVWGDADQNGEVKMNDVVLIMQSLSNADKYGLEGTDSTHITKNGKYWGDVYEHNESAPDISVMDAQQIQKFLLELIPSLDPKDFVK